MILYLVRHGHPDYETDTLLPDGVEQAKRTALRLKECGVDAICSSTMGRAMQTAKETADLLGLPITPYDWARELSEESKTTFPDGVAKGLSFVPNTYWVSPENRKIPADEAFSRLTAISGTHFPERYREISDGVDALIADHGYRRNADGFYVAEEPNEKHIALFCHAGMGRVVVSHLLHLPPQNTVSLLMPPFCSLTVFDFPRDAKPGEAVVPYLCAYGDYGHFVGEGSGGIVCGRTGERI